MAGDDGFTRAQLAGLDLAGLLAGGLCDDEGRLRPEVQGEGAVAAAIQLEDHLAATEDVARMAAALREREAEGGRPRLDPPVHPAVSRLVRLGWDPAKDARERAAFARWLGNVATVMVVRARSREEHAT